MKVQPGEIFQSHFLHRFSFRFPFSLVQFPHPHYYDSSFFIPKTYVPLDPRSTVVLPGGRQVLALIETNNETICEYALFVLRERGFSKRVWVGSDEKSFQQKQIFRVLCVNKKHIYVCKRESASVSIVRIEYEEEEEEEDAKEEDEGGDKGLWESKIVIRIKHNYIVTSMKANDEYLFFTSWEGPDFELHALNLRTLQLTLFGEFVQTWELEVVGILCEYLFVCQEAKTMLLFKATPPFQMLRTPDCLRGVSSLCVANDEIFVV